MDQAYSISSHDPYEALSHEVTTVSWVRINVEHCHNILEWRGIFLDHEPSLQIHQQVHGMKVDFRHQASNLNKHSLLWLVSLSLDMLYHTVNSTCTIQSQNVLTVTGCNVIFDITSNVVSHFKRTKLNLTLRRYKYFIDCQVYLRTSTSRREASTATYSTLTAVTLNTK